MRRQMSVIRCVSRLYRKSNECIAGDAFQDGTTFDWRIHMQLHVAYTVSWGLMVYTSASQLQSFSSEICSMVYTNASQSEPFSSEMCLNPGPNRSHIILYSNS